jgi:hypothetical protein
MGVLPGIVGGESRPIRCRSVALERDDLVVLASDGIKGGWSSGVNPSQAVKVVAASILHDAARASDDALVLAVRWRGQAR